LQPVLRRKTWTRYLGTSLDVTQREALRLRVEHNDLIELLRSMTPVERSMFEPPPAKLMLSATIASEEAKKMVQSAANEPYKSAVLKIKDHPIWKKYAPTP
jgi:hypothetical protein